MAEANVAEPENEHGDHREGGKDEDEAAEAVKDRVAGEAVAFRRWRVRSAALALAIARRRGHVSFFRSSASQPLDSPETTLDANRIGTNGHGNGRVPLDLHPLPTKPSSTNGFCARVRGDHHAQSVAGKADRKSPDACTAAASRLSLPTRRKSSAYAVHVHGEKRQKKGILTMVEEGKKAPDFELPDADGKSGKAVGPQGPSAGALFLSQGRHFWVHGGGQGLHLPHRRFQAHRRRGDRHFPGQPREPPQVPRRNTGSAFVCWRTRPASAAEAYGVWVEKSMYGRKYMGVERATFLIDKAGKVARSWRSVRVPGHAEEVLEAVRALET